MSKRKQSKLDESIEALFQFTRSKITGQDIVDFSPNDPGYPSYVKLWKYILRTGVVPERTGFDLSEVIGLTGWSNPIEEQYPERFRNYRRFTSAVAAALLCYGNDSESVRPANYLARDLIIDLNRSDPKHLILLRKAFPEIKARLTASGEEVEYPFFTFGEVILAQIAGDFEASELAASQLIKEESSIRTDETMNYLIQNQHFLLGLTVYDQLHSDWLKFSRELINTSGHEDMQFIIDSFKK